MSFVPDTQQGATFVVSDLSVTMTTEDIGSIGLTHPTIAIPHLGSTGQVPYIPGDLSDTEEFTVTHQNFGKSPKPVQGAVYTVTVTAPIATGSSSAESWAGTAICTHVGTPPFAANANELQKVETRWKFDGGQGGSAFARTPAT